MGDQSNTQQLLCFNGINGATGDYSLPPMTGEELAEFIKGERAPENLAELRFRHRSKTEKHLGVKEGVDPKNLAEAGWGVIFAYGAEPAVQEALSPLLKLREQQSGNYFHIYKGADGYRANETKSQFLARHGVGPGPADPEKMPYYLLIVGSPEVIPYKFQYQLDVQYAVGRIYFETLQEYANYAASVVATETGQIKLPHEVTFFSVANPDDGATAAVTNKLIEPLVQKLGHQVTGWTFNTFLRNNANKDRLISLLSGKQTPALLFTGSHGMEWPQSDQRQITHQGALLCQDWPGPVQWKGNGDIPHAFYFAADDLASDTNLLGLITFHFACYSSGTPYFDEFSAQAFKKRTPIADRPFVAHLPMKMLGLSKGGALATIGHVERAWTFSFDWPTAGVQLGVFEATLRRLLEGHPVGSAIEFFNERYAELASDLSVELEEIGFGKQVDPYTLADMWTANNDARSYVIVGDPAVRLAVV